MNLGLYLLGGENFLYHAIFVDKIGGTKNSYGATATCHLFSPTSQLLQQSGLCIRYQGELQTLGLGKFLLQSFPVLADSDDCISCCLELCLMSLKRACLGSTTTGICLGIGLEHYLAASVVRSLYLVAILVLAQYLGDSISYIHIYIIKVPEYRQLAEFEDGSMMLMRL